MYLVYLLRRRKNSNRHYAGGCNDMKSRIAEQNSGERKTTSKRGPWKLDPAIYFSNEAKATAFDRYLKTGSGRSFSKRHL